jgi:hypothetical protein
MSVTQQMMFDGEPGNPYLIDWPGGLLYHPQKMISDRHSQAASRKQSPGSFTTHGARIVPSSAQ